MQNYTAKHRRQYTPVSNRANCRQSEKAAVTISKLTRHTRKINASRTAHISALGHESRKHKSSIKTFAIIYLTSALMLYYGD